MEIFPLDFVGAKGWRMLWWKHVEGMELQAGITGSAKRWVAGQEQEPAPWGQNRGSEWGGGEAREEEKLGCSSVVCLNQFVIHCHTRRQSYPLLLPTRSCSPGSGGPAALRGPRSALVGKRRMRTGTNWGLRHGWEKGGGDSWSQRQGLSRVGWKPRLEAGVFWPQEEGCCSPVLLLPCGHQWCCQGQPGEYQKWL